MCAGALCGIACVKPHISIQKTSVCSIDDPRKKFQNLCVCKVVVCRQVVVGVIHFHQQQEVTLHQQFSNQTPNTEENTMNKINYEIVGRFENGSKYGVISKKTVEVSRSMNTRQSEKTTGRHARGPLTASKLGSQLSRPDARHARKQSRNTKK